MWTQFWDMHSGGGTKEGTFDKIYIEAQEEEAKIIFYNRFGHSPDRVTCTCCGEDYSTSQSETLEQSTAFHRNCRWVKDGTGPYGNGGYYAEEPATEPYRSENYMTLDEYCSKPTVLVIRAEEIKPEERRGSIPRQGYVWID